MKTNGAVFLLAATLTASPGAGAQDFSATTMDMLLPARKAVRYLQLEFDIRAVQAYDVAAAIPLIK